MKKDNIYYTNNGPLGILEYTNSKSKVLVRFLNTGYETLTTSSAIRKGTVKDYYKPTIGKAGFLGGKKYSHLNNKQAYSFFTAMHKSDTPISVDWCNFQIFCEWFINNKVDNFSIITIRNLYSDRTCIFVKKSIHALLNNPPYGVSKSKGYFYARCRVNGVQKTAPFRMTSELARIDYLHLKMNAIKSELPNIDKRLISTFKNLVKEMKEEIDVLSEPAITTVS